MKTLLVLILGLLSISVGGATAGATPEPTGAILFASNHGESYDIYAVNPDGTGLTRLTHDNKSSGPIPSPDGTLIAFDSGDVVFLMNADGSDRRPLRGCSREADWAPDSTRLVCSARGGEGLAVADAATGVTTSLTRTGNYPSWSPDGHTIAFVDEGLWVVPAGGGARRRLGRRKAEEVVPSWSPDSQRLAYPASVGEYRYDLFTIGADGSGDRRLVRNIRDTPVWSPEGSLIAFVKDVPRYVTAVYTVRIDGTALQRVSVSPAGESSSSPAWSADGATLLYTRDRYRGAVGTNVDFGGTDVFMTTPGAGEGRAVTHPFPTGGSNEDPRWMPGPLLSGTGPAPRTIVLPLARKLVLATPVESVVADGNSAVAYLGGFCGPVLVWKPLARRLVRTPSLCSYGYLGDLVLAGKRLAWTYAACGNTVCELSLETLRVGARRSKEVTGTAAWTDGGGAEIGSLVGRGNTIAFTYYLLARRKTRSAWLLLPRHGSRCPGNGDYFATPLPVCRRFGAVDSGVTTSVDGERVLTMASNGPVRLLSTRGRVLRTWRLGRGIVDAKLRGRSVAVQHGASVDVYDAVTGAKKRTRALAPDEGVRPHLLDVQGDLVVYATGGAIHLLRLSDGRDVALDITGAAPPLAARLEPTGLYVTWNQMYKRRPGRLAFVPLQTVKSL